MRLHHMFVLLVLTGLTLVSCQSKGGDEATTETTEAEAAAPAIPENAVTGVISYRENTTIPPDAKIYLRLVDLNQTGEGRLIAETTFSASGKQIPIDFVLPYDPADLTENGNFALEGYIFYVNFKLFEQIQPVAVIGNGESKDVVLMMRTARGKIGEE